MKMWENDKSRDMTEAEIAEYNKLVEEYAEVCKEQEIKQLKHDLAEGDYQIIKCMECYLLGEDLPYDIKELHKKRQGVRDKINEVI